MARAAALCLSNHIVGVINAHNDIAEEDASSQGHAANGDHDIGAGVDIDSSQSGEDSSEKDSEDEDEEDEVGFDGEAFDADAMLAEDAEDQNEADDGTMMRQ